MNLASNILSAVPDTTTGGDTAAISVTVNGIGLPVGNLNGDHLTIDYVPPVTGYTPDVSVAEAAVATDAAAHFAGIARALQSAGYRHQAQTITPAQVLGRTVAALTNAVITVGDCYVIAFGGATYHHADGATFTAGAAGAGSVAWATGTAGDGTLGGELAAGDIIHIFTK